MTLFLVILIIFLVMQSNSKLTLTAQTKEYYRKKKSNAKLQYDTACDTIKKMGEAYREAIMQLTIKDFLLNSCGKLQTDGRYDEKDVIENPELLKYDFRYHERMWMVITAKACGYKLNKQCLSKLYTDVWYSIPTEYSKEFLDGWKNKYNMPLANSKQLEIQLKASILLKQKILHDEEDGNSYVAYNNPYALNYVAQKFNLPTIEEKKIMDSGEYENLQNLCFDFTCRHSHTKGQEYQHIPLTMICENPTEEQKKIQYAKLSYEENISEKARQRHDIIKKYDL